MKKFLIIQTAYLGDVILATAVVEKLRQYYPDADLDMMVKKGAETLLEAHPYVRRLWVWNKKKKYASLYGILKKVRSERYDYIINLQRHSTTALFTLFSGAKRRIGFLSTPFSVFLTEKKMYPKTCLPESGNFFLRTFCIKKKHFPKQALHEVEKNHLLIRTLTDPQYAFPKLYFSEPQQQRIQPLIARPFLTLSIGTAWATKQLPLSKWLDFLSKIPKPYVVYLLGGAQERAVAEQLREKNTNERLRLMNLCGQLDLTPSALLMRYAVMNYALDSSATHLATASGAPVTTVFTSTDPKFGFYPLSPESFIVRHKERLPCHPCTRHGKKSCPKKHYLCAYRIAAEDLLCSLPD